MSLCSIEIVTDKTYGGRGEVEGDGKSVVLALLLPPLVKRTLLHNNMHPSCHGIEYFRFALTCEDYSAITCTVVLDRVHFTYSSLHKCQPERTVQYC